MSKTWQTKDKILKSLKQKPKTLTDLSSELSLAPSTISQHLHELLRAGRISESSLSASRKWKYYQVNVALAEAIENKGKWDPRNSSRLAWIAAALAIVLAAGTLAFYSGSRVGVGAPTTTAVQELAATSNSLIGNGTTVFSISDSPETYNITGIYLNISSIAVRNASTGGFISLPLATDSANLVALDNISQVVANASLPAGAYDLVVLNISSAYATVNGKAEGLVMPEGGKSISLNISFNVSDNTTNWLNMDVDLEKSLHLTGNGTIVMLPSVTATYYRDAGLQVTSNELLSVQRTGEMVNARHFDMDLEGIMMQNATIYENYSYSVNAATGAITVTGPLSNGTWLRSGNSIIAVPGGTGRPSSNAVTGSASNSDAAPSSSGQVAVPPLDHVSGGASNSDAGTGTANAAIGIGSSVSDTVSNAISKWTIRSSGVQQVP